MARLAPRQASKVRSISSWLPSRRSTAHQIGGLVMTALGHRRSLRSTGLKGTYFSPAVGIMGFWVDIGRLLAPRTAGWLETNTAKDLERWRRLLVETRRTTCDPQGPRK